MYTKYFVIEIIVIWNEGKCVNGDKTLTTKMHNELNGQRKIVLAFSYCSRIPNIIELCHARNCYTEFAYRWQTLWMFYQWTIKYHWIS